MADVQPLRALHYDLARVGGLQPVAAPPYDVIDAAQRAELVARSPYNVVEIDLPQNAGGVAMAGGLKRYDDGARRMQRNSIRVFDHGSQRHRRVHPPQSHAGDPDYN